MKIYKPLYDNGEKTYREYDITNLKYHESLPNYISVLHNKFDYTINLISDEFYLTIDDVMKFWNKVPAINYKLKDVKIKQTV